MNFLYKRSMCSSFNKGPDLGRHRSGWREMRKREAMRKSLRRDEKGKDICVCFFLFLLFCFFFFRNMKAENG